MTVVIVTPVIDGGAAGICDSGQALVQTGCCGARVIVDAGDAVDLARALSARHACAGIPADDPLPCGV